MFKDNKDFYPTPSHLFRQLINGNRNIRGRILEPSAGKGDMIKHIKDPYRRSEDLKIDAIENDERLVSILQNDGINVVWDDFLTYETYKEYDFIIMNPPFSNGVDHALKAIKLAEDQLTGCELYIILNKATLDNAFSNKRKELLEKLEELKAEVRYVKDGFTQAERRTGVEVALIHISTPMTGNGKGVYDRIPFFNHDIESNNDITDVLSTFVKSSEIQEKLNDIERLITEYETACELVRDAYRLQREKISFIKYANNVNSRGGIHNSKLSYVIKKEHSSLDLNEELDGLRRGYWQLILETDELRDLLTNEGIQALNRRLNLAEEMEINRTNVKMLLMAIKANQNDMLTESVVAIFKEMTKYHMNQYSSNIHYYNGWKSNNAYKVNKKVVIPISQSITDWNNFNSDYSKIRYSVRNYIDDMVKAFQLIDSSVNNDFKSISDQEFENDLLRFKMFKNGNIHIWFKDLNLLDKLNYLCGQHFNWIPSDDEIKTDAAAKDFVEKEFKEVYSENLLAGAM